MFSGDRSDGKLVRKAPKMRQFMPYIMPRRGDAVFFLKQKIDVTETRAYLKRWNDGTRPRLRLYHIYLAAYARMLADFPRLNRFIAGRRLYQRTDIAISMPVLKSRSEDATVKTVKQIYDPGTGLTGMRASTEEIIKIGRSDELTASEREVALMTKLPRWLIPLLLKLLKLGDWLNVTPGFLSESDPLYSSLMVSNNGSLRLSSAYHHLYEHGTVPLFAVVGPDRDEPVVTKAREIEIRPIVTIRYTLDERVVDGHYGARAAAYHKKLVENPWLMETPEDNGPGAPES